jgi:hypothetical protein
MNLFDKIRKLYNTPGYAESLFFYNDIVYIADGASCLQIIDVSDPFFSCIFRFHKSSSQ